ncbi:hypothetical protein FHR81_005195 [Actinoalloteichus hoggarensis]|uniref:Uncharacterized protein n=1 Tax=Actinoalloteichus hoggarensis TaxID=1470176 RepID=A0A221W9Q6_9PSEU|nr:hypothetical protein AHOG_25675 [Actinoalloteichus hoggarensis]MBB5924118.1 hypothetical protein [Actinoalloteichus hoggarensis]
MRRVDGADPGGSGRPDGTTDTTAEPRATRGLTRIDPLVSRETASPSHRRHPRDRSGTAETRQCVV